MDLFYVRIQRGGRGSGTPPPLKKQKAIGFLSNTDPDTLKNHKATQPTLNVGSSSARERNAILMAIRSRAHDDPLLVYFGPICRHQLKEKETLAELVPL